MFRSTLYWLVAIGAFFGDIVFLFWVGVLSAIMVVALIIGNALQIYLTPKGDKLYKVITKIL